MRQSLDVLEGCSLEPCSSSAKISYARKMSNDIIIYIWQSVEAYVYFKVKELVAECFSFSYLDMYFLDKISRQHEAGQSCV